MPSIGDKRDIDIDDLAIAQRLVIGNAMADHMIDRGADGPWIAAVIERSRNGIVRYCELHHHAVELGGGDARLHMRRYEIEGFSAKPASPSHAGKTFRTVQLDLPGIGKRCQRSVYIGHKKK